jgi:hypothetical protein
MSNTPRLTRGRYRLSRMAAEVEGNHTHVDDEDSIVYARKPVYGATTKNSQIVSMGLWFDRCHSHEPMTGHL